MKTAKLFVFEGADEVGKTTLATMLVETLRSRGVSCENFAFPGKKLGTLGWQINQLHHAPAEFNIASIDPTSLQVLHIAAHIDAIEAQILPALKKHRAVVLDRYWWSTWIYGTANMAKKTALKAALEAEKVHWKGILPSHLFLVTRSAPLVRQQDLVKWKTIGQLYKRFAAQQKGQFPITLIQNDSTVEVAFEHISKRILKI